MATPVKTYKGRVVCHRECPTCRTLFPVTSDYKEQKYCCHSCSIAGRKITNPGPAPRPCEYCGTVFVPIRHEGRFCTSSCASRGVAKIKGAKQKPTHCVICGKPVPFTKNGRKTCGTPCFQALLSVNSAKPRLNRAEFIPGTILDKYGHRHKLHEIAGPFPLPVDPQWCPMGWVELLEVA